MSDLKRGMVLWFIGYAVGALVGWAVESSRTVSPPLAIEAPKLPETITRREPYAGSDDDPDNPSLLLADCFRMGPRRICNQRADRI